MSEKYVKTSLFNSALIENSIIIGIYLLSITILVLLNCIQYMYLKMHTYRYTPYYIKLIYLMYGHAGGSLATLLTCYLTIHIHIRGWIKKS